MKANQEIRIVAKNAGVKLWQVAEQLNMNDGNFSRKLRFELPKNEKDKIIEIIQSLSQQKGEENHA